MQNSWLSGGFSVTTHDGMITCNAALLAFVCLQQSAVLVSFGVVKIGFYDSTRVLKFLKVFLLPLIS